ncbi:MAG: sugar phosphate isomerase/epimerase [Planctomycetota bacterium]|nr:sugar phosphate isomerase/epimerase [Planctomycetota bacterium]MDA1211017.1 sugar phosphate isomerase/epimerase [Planctomycetota bacterium]
MTTSQFLNDLLPDRRDFLVQTGSALAAVGLMGLTHPMRVGADDTKNHGIKKAVKYSMVAGDAPMVEKFKLLKAIGFEGIDMNVPADHDEVNAAQKESGLIVHGVVSYDHWKKPFSHPDPEVRSSGLESFLGAIRDAHAYGASSVLLVPAVVNKDISYDQAYDYSQQEIRKAIPLAEDLGIDILIENVWNSFLLSPLELAQYLDEFDTPHIGAYFDVGNVVRYGWPEQWIRILGPRIKKLDIKEYSRELESKQGPSAGFKVKIGDGDCDWPAVMRALDDIGYTGWGTAEVPGGGRDELADISLRMDKAFSTLA